MFVGSQGEAFPTEAGIASLVVTATLGTLMAARTLIHIWHTQNMYTYLVTDILCFLNKIIIKRVLKILRSRKIYSLILGLFWSVK